MPLELDHLLVPVRDRQSCAQLLARILDVPWAESGIGPFPPVYISDSLTLDFDEAQAPYPVQHYMHHWEMLTRSYERRAGA